MANKALAKRQKLSFRVEPSQKPARGAAPAAGRPPRPSGPQPGKAPVQRQLLERLLRSRTGNGTD